MKPPDSERADWFSKPTQTCEVLSPVVPTELSAVPTLVHVGEVFVLCGSVGLPTHALKTTSARLLK